MPEAPATPRSDIRAALRALLVSLFVNALCPFLLYRYLEPRYPAGSIVPLLYASAFPVFGFLLGLARTRRADAIAILSLAGIGLHIAVTLIAKNVGIALVARSLDGLLIGLALIVSTAIGRPIILYVARQAAGAAAPGSRLEAVVEREGVRPFSVVTAVWGICLMAMSGVHAALALFLAPADFLLASPILGVATNLTLMAWTGFYLSRRARALEK